MLGMLMQVTMSGAVLVNVTHSAEFFENRVWLGVRARGCLSALRPVCGEAGGVLVKDNAVPFLQVVNDGDGQGPAGSTLSHWALGLSSAIGTGGRVTLSVGRHQRELPVEAMDPARYYVFGAVGARWMTPTWWVEVEGVPVVPKRWRSVAARVRARGAWRYDRWMVMANAVMHDAGDQQESARTTGEVGVGFRPLVLMVGTEVVPLVDGRPGHEVNRFVRVGVQFAVGQVRP